MFNRLARVALVCLAFAAIACAQIDRYNVVVEGSKSAASAVVTIQQPASGSKTVQMLSVAVQCSTTCPVYIDRDGTAATTTAASVAKANPGTSPAAVTKAFSDSDVGAGAQKLTPTYNVPANVIQPFDMTGVYLEGDGTSKNVNVHVGPFTGTYSIQVVFAEKR